MKRQIVALALMAAATILFFHVSDLHAQCAMCVTALENSPEGKGMASSFNNGILFLLVLPYAIFGTVGAVVFRAHRRKKTGKGPDNPYIPRP